MKNSPGPMNICVMISGSGTNLQSLLVHYPYEGGEAKPARVAFVVSDNPGAFGLERAKKAGVRTRVISPKDFATPEEFGLAHIRLMKEEGIDLIVLAGYLKLLPANLVSEFRNRMINIHPALLPSFGGKGMYGARVHHAVIESGVKLSGLTIHFVDERYDHGPILLQHAVPVFFTDTPEALAKRILAHEHRLLPRAVGLIAAGRVEVRGQRVFIDGEENLEWSRLSPSEMA